MRHVPYVTKAHSANSCQCSSRMPPDVSRILTPAIVSEIWKSYCVTCRAQPPFWIRFAALLNEAQNCGMSFVEVAGGETAAGNWSAIAGLCGPGSARLAGFVALTAPCGGVSGLPKPCARALEGTDVAARLPTPAAAPPSSLRRATSTMATSIEALLSLGASASDRSSRLRQIPTPISAQTAYRPAPQAPSSRPSPGGFLVCWR